MKVSNRQVAAILNCIAREEQFLSEGDYEQVLSLVLERESLIVSLPSLDAISKTDLVALRDAIYRVTRRVEASRAGAMRAKRRIDALGNVGFSTYTADAVIEHSVRKPMTYRCV